MTRADWVWMPHPGHFMGGRDCRFHLCTWVGHVIVSTVGEYLPDEPVREIIARGRGISLSGKGDARLNDFMEKVGYPELGLGRTYETMVFRAVPRDPHPTTCCPYQVGDFQELAMCGYTTAGDAYRGHLALCEEWSGKTPSERTPDSWENDE